MSPEELQGLLRKCWSRETSVNSEYWGKDNPAYGQCVATSQLIQKLLGGEIMGGKTKAPGCIFTNTLNHFWNRLPDGQEIDLTKEQFPEGTMILNKKIIEKSYFSQFPEAIKKYKALKATFEKLQKAREQM